MSMTMHRLQRTATTVLMILLVATVSSLSASDTAAEGPVGVEKWDAPCSPGGGDPMTIETTYPGTSRVEITWLGCSCFDTADEAAAWIGELAQIAMDGDLLDVEESQEREHTMTADLEPGQEVPLVAYCLTDEQIVEYLRSLQPRVVDMRDGN